MMRIPAFLPCGALINAIECPVIIRAKLAGAL